MSKNEDAYKLMEKDLRWLGVDLDNCLACNTGYPDFSLTDPVVGAKKAMEKLNADGWKIIIYTARHWQDYELIEKWLDKYNIPYRRIVCGKLFCKWLIDDRAIGFRNDDWDDVVRQINE